MKKNFSLKEWIVPEHSAICDGFCLYQRLILQLEFAGWRTDYSSNIFGIWKLKLTWACIMRLNFLNGHAFENMWWILIHLFKTMILNTKATCLLITLLKIHTRLSPLGTLGHVAHAPPFCREVIYFFSIWIALIRSKCSL